jgi:TPR repeat protein
MINKKLRQKMETNFSTLVRSCYEWKRKAQFYLGTCYDFGHGVRKDTSKALKGFFTS